MATLYLHIVLMSSWVCASCFIAACSCDGDGDGDGDFDTLCCCCFAYQIAAMVELREKEVKKHQLSCRTKDEVYMSLIDWSID